MENTKFRVWDKNKKEMFYLSESQMSEINLSMNNNYWGLFDGQNRICGNADNSATIRKPNGNLFNFKKREIMKLELKHLSAYLPYGIEMYSDDYWEGDEIEWRKETLAGICKWTDGEEDWWDKDGDNFNIQNSGFKPILRPLSDLTKEIEVNRERFVPIVELLKNATTQIWGIYEEPLLDINILSEGDSAGVICYNDTERVSFTLDKDDIWFDFALWVDGSVMNINKYSLFQKLLEYHFDIFNLIENGLAIDINTLDK